MSSETAELEQLVSPIDKMVVRCLQKSKNGVTIMDIVHRVQSKLGKDHGNLEQEVSRVLENAIELGFIEKSKPDEACTCKGGRSHRGRGRSRSRARRRRIRRRRLRPRGL